MLPKGLLKEYWGAFSLLNRVVDMFMVFVAGWLAFAIKFDSIVLPPEYSLALLVGACVATLTFAVSGLYSSIRTQGYFSHFMQISQAVALLALVLAGIGSLTKTSEIFSRLWFGSWMLGALSCLILYRCVLLTLLHVMRRRGFNERRVVIIGAGVLGGRFAESVQQALWTGYKIVAYFDDAAKFKPDRLHGIPVLQTPDDLGAYLKKESIDEVWLALPLRAESRVKSILYALRHQTVNIRFVLDIFGLDLVNHSVSEVAGVPVLNIQSSPMVGINRAIKALEDRVLASIILLLISPVMLCIALGIKLTSKGPILFKQSRLGWDGKIINVYKFRTMFVHQEKDGAVTQASANDNRVTPFGRFLRRTSLDELPQFINVLQGRMSIVGPRPHALQHNEHYKDLIHDYMQRHRVKPGITGWAQINGWRGETDTLNKMEKRVEYDLYYINNWSFMFDLKIIFLTIFRGFIHRNAY